MINCDIKALKIAFIFLKKFQKLFESMKFDDTSKVKISGSLVGKNGSMSHLTGLSAFESKERAIEIMSISIVASYRYLLNEFRLELLRRSSPSTYIINTIPLLIKVV